MNAGREVVLVEAVRTPIGRGDPERGLHRDTHPADLLGTCFSAVLGRSGAEPGAVEAVVAGCVQQFGVQGLNVARTAWLGEGLPIETAATTVDTQCGSGQQAVNFAASLIASGAHDVVVAGGVEHMGSISFAAGEDVQERYGRAHSDRLLERYDIVGQGLSAEMVAERWQIPRQELDELALLSHQRAAAATEAGWFDREIVATEAPDGPATRDQGIRANTSLEALAGLRPAFKEGGVITAGNSSQISDGAAAVLLASASAAARLGLKPRARLVDHLTVGCDPVLMLEGPIPATAAILSRQRMNLSDLDLIEVNEAFAPVVAAWLREHRTDMERVNVRGGAIALGHPLGSSGARLITTLLHTLEDHDAQFGLVTMCCAGGLGTATLIEQI